MRGTGQPLCSQTRTATCCSTCAAPELWLLLQLNSLLRVPYVRMHFRPSDQASWVVASHKARFSGPGFHVPGIHSEPEQPKSQDDARRERLTPQRERPGGPSSRSETWRGGN